MRIAIMAAGALGGYFGARFAAAGHDVIFFARGAHRAAIEKNGLRIESPLGNLHLPKVTLADDPAKIGTVDIILFAVKLWDLEKAASELAPLIGPATRVITVQNGVDALARLEPILGKGRVVCGLAQIATVISEPGVIKHTSQFALLRFGHYDNHPDLTLDAFVEAARKINLDIALSDNMLRDSWIKFTFLTALAGITAATRRPIGPLLADADGRALFHDLMAEIVAVGRAKGVPLPENFADERMGFADTVLPKDMKASMAHDLERGNRIELDWLTGKVVELGREVGIATPANAALYAVLKPYRMGKSA
ncbi:MAG TPA: 2-dehydropantoate 2-reductase [Pseudolabrys sp.]|nr:2-dehydropantoate 2-reductase [Pseudolabrys sp.]